MIQRFIYGLTCIFVAAGTLYAYIDKHNSLTALRLAIPSLAKEVRKIHEQNIQLKYELEQLENPVLLMELLKKPEYSHLKYPHLNEQIIIYK